jgi:uncharacterized protein (DUF58 family)
MKKLLIHFRRSRLAGPERQILIRRVLFRPTVAGVGFFCAALLICSFAINFQTKFGYATGFIIASTLIVAVPLTYWNLFGILVEADEAEPVFAGEHVAFPIVLTLARRRWPMIGSRPRYSVAVKVTDIDGSRVSEFVDVVGQQPSIARVRLKTVERGILTMPRTTVATTYPLGLMRMWTSWTPQVHGVVYPAPEPNAPKLLDVLAGGNRHGNQTWSGTEVDGLRPYRTGDRPRQISWRHSLRLRRGPQLALVSKSLSEQRGGRLTITDEMLPSDLNFEDRISRICSWVLEADREGCEYAVNALGIERVHGRGHEHKHEILSALALCKEKRNGSETI